MEVDQEKFDALLRLMLESAPEPEKTIKGEGKKKGKILPRIFNLPVKEK